MGIIQPDSTIILLKNIPLDPTYEHTICWEVDGAETLEMKLNRQTAYFTGANAPKVLTLLSQTYTRLSKKKIRIEITTESTWAEIMKVNYMCFKNISFQGRWFYAFVTNVEYINNRVCEIEFELDVMQTWYFDYTLGMCFVEREHTTTDNLFENLVPENLEIGNTYISKHRTDYDLNEQKICVLFGYPDETRPAIPSEWGDVINGIYSPIKRSVYDIPDRSDADYSQKIGNINYSIVAGIGSQNIIAIYQYPKLFEPDINGEPISHEVVIPDNWTPQYQNASIGNHIVRNKKLLTYPYNFICVSNNAGQTAEYYFENWTKPAADSYKFYVKGVCVTQPVGICYPHLYRGITSDYEDGITMSNFPVCAWMGSAFKEWWAQNKNSFLTSNIASILGGYASTATSVGVGAALGTIAAPEAAAIIGGVGVGISTVTTVANAVAKIQDLKSAPPQLRGQVQSDCLNSALSRYVFSFYHLQIKQEFAEIIDDYFDRYGYACKRNKIPNRYARPYWCFTKTLDCNITANDIPNTDIVKICKIYNNGITFWKWKSDPHTNLRVGDYTQNNQV